MHFHWQNLNEDRDGNPKGWPWHGRAWLEIGSLSLTLEWSAWTRFAHGYVNASGEDGLKFGAALPPVALWLGVRTPRLSRWLHSALRYDGCEIGWHVFDGALRWRLWADPDSWEHDRPRWRDGSFNVVDAVLGKEVLTTRPVEARDVVIPLPERGYRATVQIEDRIVSRVRWFARTWRGSHVRMHDGEQLPIPGKGENSWDCGNDAIYAQSNQADSVEQAVARIVESVLRVRQQRGGSWSPPSPEVPPVASVEA